MNKRKQYCEWLGLSFVCLVCGLVLGKSIYCLMHYDITIPSVYADVKYETPYYQAKPSHENTPTENMSHTPINKTKSIHHKKAKIATLLVFILFFGIFFSIFTRALAEKLRDWIEPRNKNNK